MTVAPADPFDRKPLIDHFALKAAYVAGFAAALVFAAYFATHLETSNLEVWLGGFPVLMPVWVGYLLIGIGVMVAVIFRDAVLINYCLGLFGGAILSARRVT